MNKLLLLINEVLLNIQKSFWCIFTENSGDSSPPAKTLKITPNGGAASDKSAHNTAPSAVVVVSSKTSDATPKMSLQERMLALQENFKLDSSTQGAEAIRRQREEEMNVVRNRWKCGLPSDGSSKPITAEDNTVRINFQSRWTAKYNLTTSKL